MVVRLLVRQVQERVERRGARVPLLQVRHRRVETETGENEGFGLCGEDGTCQQRKCRGPSRGFQQSSTLQMTPAIVNAPSISAWTGDTATTIVTRFSVEQNSDQVEGLS
jgi:hypothetical protein